MHFGLKDHYLSSCYSQISFFLDIFETVSIHKIERVTFLLHVSKRFTIYLKRNYLLNEMNCIKTIMSHSLLFSMHLFSHYEIGKQFGKIFLPLWEHEMHYVSNEFIYTRWAQNAFNRTFNIWISSDQTNLQV